MVFCCEIFLVASLNQVFAAPQKKEGPTKIRSEIIDIKRKSQTIDFLKNVTVEKDDSSMLAQKMTVIYFDKDADNPEKNSSIKRIDASDNVKIFTEEFVANGEIGHYDPIKDIFVLEKNVIVNNGSSVASGDKFVYDLTTKKGYFVGKNESNSISGRLGGVSSNDKRVVVVIGNEIKDQKKSEKKSKSENNEQDIKRP